MKAPKKEKVIKTLVIILQELENELKRFQTIECNIHNGVYHIPDNDDWEFCLNEAGHISDEKKKYIETFKQLIHKWEKM